MRSTMKKGKKKRSMPQWQKDIINQFTEEAELLMRTLRISAKGVMLVTRSPNLMEIRKKLIKLNLAGSELKSKIDEDEVREEAKLAESEMKKGFPVINSWGVVTLWGLLEAVIRRFVAENIKRRKSLWSLPELKKLKIRLGEYETMPQEDRYLYIADLLEKEVAAGVRNGTNRFESLLAPFGLDGEVPENAARSLFELGQIRNAIVHRAGKVDKQLLDSCPWLTQKRNESIKVTSGMMNKYFYASTVYITMLIFRIQKTYGHELASEIEELYEIDRTLVR